MLRSSRPRTSSRNSPQSSKSASTFKRSKRNMYSSVFIRLKSRPHEKPVESQRNRAEVETALKALTLDAPFEIHSTHASNLFAAKLSTPINSHDQIPQPLLNTLQSHRLVEDFAPAIIVRESKLSADGQRVAPTVEECMDEFQKWLPSLPLDPYEAFGVHVVVSRLEKQYNHAIQRDFGTNMRDAVQDYMAKNHPTLPCDRSPEMKAKIQALRDTAQKKSKDTNTAYLKPTLRTLPLHIDVTRDSAFWYTHPQSGGAVAKSAAEIQNAITTAIKAQSIEERVGQPVLICKIGEIFLKKGNRGKFLYQLQSNMAFKLEGKATVTRHQYNFVLTPHKKARNRPFTDAELADVRDIVTCIPGIDQIQLAYETNPTEGGIITTMQYLLGVASLGEDVSCKLKPIEGATIFKPRQVHVEAAFKFLKGANIPAEQRTPEQSQLLSAHQDIELNAQRASKRVQRLAKRVEDVVNCGFKIDASLTQPCYYSSKSRLARTLFEKMVTATSDLVYGPKSTTQVLDPGRYQRQLRLEQAQIKDPLDSDEEDAPTVSYDSDGEMNDEERAVPVTGWVKPKSGVTFKVDVFQKHAYVGLSSDIQPGVGGQPIGTGQETETVVALLSGGMDSPVAAYSLMKRGLRVILVHFQNANLADEETVQNKILQLSDHLSKYQMSTYLHIVPFSAIQDAIITEVPSPARMLVYRRFMFSIAAKIAKSYDAKFLVVGDALGQVASQTPSNMFASYSNAPMPLLSPLVGSNKTEIMDIARHIGTYDISALPYGDCCSYFLAKHPLTSIKKELLHEYERNVGRAIDGGNEQLIVEAQNAAAIYRWFKPSDGMKTLRPMIAVKSYHDNAASLMLDACPTNPKNIGNGDLGEEATQFIGRDDNLTQADIEKMMDPAELAKMKAQKRKNYDKEQGSADAVDLDDKEESQILQQQTIKKQNPPQQQSMNDDGDDDKVAIDGGDIPAGSSQIVAYLDSASTTRLLPNVANVVQRFTSGQLYGNSSSLHLVGKTSDLAVKNATSTLLSVINAHPQNEQQQLNVYGIGGDDRMIYTSGGTEANNLAIFGSLRHAVQNQIDTIVKQHGLIPVGGKLAADQSYPTQLAAKNIDQTQYVLCVHLITSQLEHSAILEPLQFLQQSPDFLIDNRYGLNISINIALSTINNESDGVVSPDHLSRLLSTRPHLTNTPEILQRTGIDVNTASPSNVKMIDVATFVTVMHANNEIGTIQPLPALGQVITAHRQQSTQPFTTNDKIDKLLKKSTIPQVLFHTDACQSFGKLNIDVQHCGLDLLTLNGHKLHGVKGIGGLYVRPGVKLTAMQLGGKHQHNLRSGTLNVPGIVAMQHAALWCHSIPSTTDLNSITKFLHTTYKPTTATTSSIHDTLTQHGKEMRQKQFKFMLALKQLFPQASIHGPNKHFFSQPSNQLLQADIDNLDSHLYTTTTHPSLPSVISILFDPSSQLDSPGIVKYLSTRGVCVSAGSACASNNSEPKPSHVLKGIGLKDQHSNGTVRLSLSVLTSQRELDNALIVFKSLANDLHTITKSARQ